MTVTSTFLAAFREPGELIHVRALRPRGMNATSDNYTFKMAHPLAWFAENESQLEEVNKTRGLFFVVNAGGDTDAEINRFVAWFVENDSLTLTEQHERLASSPLLASVLVETRKSVHAYWLIDGPCSETEWRDMQARLIDYFGGDKSIKNPSRLMRLPNFDHLFLNGAGLERKRVAIHTFEPERRYTFKQMGDAFPVRNGTGASGRAGSTSFESHDERHAELCERIRARGKRNSKGNWDARCLAHNGNGSTSLVYFPSSGAVKCNAKPECDYFAILRAEGLPDNKLPKRRKRRTGKQPKDATESAPKEQEMFAEVEPYHEAVNGGELLSEIVTLTRRYVDASEAIHNTAALWALFTYAFESFFCLPILAVISPVKRSGKSTLLQCLNAIVAKSVVASSISAAALFRIVEKYKPTLLLDEADTFLNDKNKDELRGVINSGHTRNTAFAIRCDDKFEPRQYSTFCPKVIAMIGHPRDTTMDRCIPLEMQRAEPGTPLEYLRADRLAQAGALIRAKASRFVLDNKKALADADPQIPDEITNARARDNWRPLLALADLCGGEWLERARKAAKDISGSNSVSDDTLTEALLWDIREIFKEKKTDRVFSKDLVEALCDALDRPWSETNNHGAITANWLAHKLKPFHIHPKTIRIDETTSKGYTLIDFKDAFARYLPQEDCRGFRP